MTVAPGTLLAGKYRVEHVLGEGGMGVVVAAQHEQLGQRVAMKFLLPGACENPTVVTRFLREARAAVQIKSEHVARVIDVGTLDGGEPYIVMEYLEGADLSQTVRALGPLTVSDAADFVLQACEALAEAHSLGIVHRDLKPSNLFVTKRADGSPLVKVLDFGISKLLTPEATGVEAANLTNTAAVMGSPMYMSPEQVRDSKNVDARTDLWSLGIILQELLSGKTPFHAETLAGLLAAIVADAPRPVREVCPHIPVELERVISRCLEKDPGNRFQNVAELALALAPFGGKSSSISLDRISRLLLGEAPPMAAAAALAGPAGQAEPAVAGVGPTNVTAASWGQTQREARRAPRSVWVAVALGACLAVGGGAVLISRLLGSSSVEAATAELGAPGENTLPPPPASVSAASVDVPSSSASGAPEALPAPSTTKARTASARTGQAKASASPSQSPASASVAAPDGPKPLGGPAPLQGRK